MKVTAFTRQALAMRREQRDLPKLGWEMVGEGGGRLWELKRGARVGQRILAVRVAACGTAVWIRVGASDG